MLLVAHQPVPQLRTFFAAQDSRLQAIQDTCSAAQGRVADLELTLADLVFASTSPGEPVRQVRSFFANCDMEIEAGKIACECAQDIMVELLRVLEALSNGIDG